MRRNGILALFVGLVSSLGVSAALSAQAGGVEQALMQMEREWAQAIAKRDQAALDRILANDWAITDANGQMITKAQDDSDRKSGVAQHDAFSVDDMTVRVFGDTAIVNGRSTMKGSYKGKDISGQYRFTDVFLRRAGRWQAVVTHVSRIGQPN